VSAFGDFDYDIDEAIRLVTDIACLDYSKITPEDLQTIIERARSWLSKHASSVGEP
jgi:hypothetical protein